MKTTAKVFVVIGMVVGSWLILPIFLGVWAWKKIDTAKSRQEMIGCILVSAFFLTLFSAFFMSLIKFDNDIAVRNAKKDIDNFFLKYGTVLNDKQKEEFAVTAKSIMYLSDMQKLAFEYIDDTPSPADFIFYLALNAKNVISKCCKKSEYEEFLYSLFTEKYLITLQDFEIYEAINAQKQLQLTAYPDSPFRFNYEQAVLGLICGGIIDKILRHEKNEELITTRQNILKYATINGYYT